VTSAPPARWNHNIHYHRVVLDALPAGCARVLDVGCGEGTLARELAAKSREVVGIDLDEPSVASARAATDASNVDYLLGDALTYPFEPASFNAVVSVAALHHMGTEAGLTRCAGLVRPGGVIAVVGLARSEPRDLLLDLAGAVAAGWFRFTRSYWEHPSPTVWPPPETYAQTRAIARRVLPGVQYRRHVLWRYSLTWARPG
jgi:2-polyprenyl-3-methyl-5-hydroxy-6-metoxy-1,4-benzoquinol methylase